MNKMKHNVIIVGKELPEISEQLNKFNIYNTINSILIDETDIIVLINQSSEIIKQYDKLDNKLIVVSVKANSGFVFVNAGENHMVINNNNQIVMIGSIIDNVCICPPNYFHNLKTNDIIKFINVDGDFHDLCNTEHIIEVLSPTTFKLKNNIINTNGFRNATCVLENKPYFISHKKYSEHINKYEESKYSFVFPPINNMFINIVVSEIIKLITNVSEPINQFWYWKDDMITTNTFNNSLSTTIITDDNKIICDSLLSLGFTNCKSLNINDQCSLSNVDIIVEISDNNKLKHSLNEYSFQNDVPYFTGTIESSETYSIVPYLTNTLFDMYKPKEKQSYPMCVIKSFPINIEQTIDWAKEHFDDSVVSNINIFEECVYKAIEMFNHYYVKNIQELLTLFPSGHMIKNSINEDVLYWSNGKRQPHIIDIDINYITITSKIIANNHNIDIKNKNIKDNICEIISTYNNYNSKENDFKNIFKLSKQNINNDLYLEYIDIASRLRASNYNIPYYSVKKNVINDTIVNNIIIDNIIIEVFKYVLSKNKIIDKKYYSSIEYNLSKDIILYKDELAPENNIIGGLILNKWVKFRYNEDSTIYEFKSVFDKMFNTDITIIIYNNIMLYADVLDTNNLNKKLSTVIKEKTKTDTIPSSCVLSIACDDDDIILPDIHFLLD